MRVNQAKEKMDDLKERIRRADYRYYIMDDPEISDKEYDILMEELKKLEENHPQFITPDSPTRRVSGGVSGNLAVVEHSVKMLSLDNTYSVDEIKDWDKRVKRVLKKDENIAYFAELKIDGVSCSFLYRDGLFVRGATRGDGERGEDVTHNIKTIKSLPLKLRGENIPKVVEVRGEVYISKKDFSAINTERGRKGEALFANPRNAAAGSVKLLQPAIAARRGLNYYVHSFALAQGDDFSAHADFLKKAKDWGLNVNPHNRLCSRLDEVLSFCKNWRDNRESLDYEVDGVVIKVNSFSLRNILGNTLKSPRWAIAYKFPAKQAVTEIHKIEFSVGRTGIITPVALLQPVKCAGVVISRVTLHNFDEVRRLDVREKDSVLIERAGDVIPKVVKVIERKGQKRGGRVKPPEKCPACLGAVSKEKEAEVYVYCLNPDCPAQIKRALLHFASRGAMDIEGLGESVVDELVNRGVVKSIVDIYKLTREDFLSIPLFKERKSSNLIKAIENSKQRPLARFIYALGIRHIGEKAAALLADKFPEIEMFFGVKAGNIEEIPEVGPVMAESIVKFFAQDNIKNMIREFKNTGLRFAKHHAKSGSSLKGLKFVFTGELKKYSRRRAREVVERNGGEWAAAVSANIDFVVVGDNPGGKYAKAKELGVKIIGEGEFTRMVD